MEIWIPVDVQPLQVQEEVQKWLDKYSFHAYKSIESIPDTLALVYPKHCT